MNPPRPLAVLRAGLVLCATLLLSTAQAQAVYRCGNSYGSTPCHGGRLVEVDDARSDAQRQQAMAVRQQESALARTLAAERRERERDLAASARLAAAGIGPTAAERHRAELQAPHQARTWQPEPRRPIRRAKRPPTASFSS